ncbi:MAG: AAA family ATPase [Desulfobulbaceae bacterium]|nr:AAA family ATPase [Desulfobulbaceae bacterium]
MANELIVNNPLRALGLEDKADGKVQAMMGLVMARAGLGKTAILVQFALDCMLLGNKVLHVSIGEGVDKTRTWYDDILSLLTDGEKIESIPEVMKNRMIMTFKESSFTKALLEERLDDLVQQNIYKPECLIIDGYDFDNNDKKSLEDLRDFMNERGLKMIWFSAVSHRDDKRVSIDGVPAPCHEVDSLFDTVLLINPDGDAMKLDIVKCDSCSVDPGSTLMLDPSTMLIKQG